MWVRYCSSIWQAGSPYFSQRPGPAPAVVLQRQPTGRLWNWKCFWSRNTPAAATVERTSRRTVVSDWRDWTRDKATGQDFFSFVFAVLLFIFILLYLPSSSISLSYFNLAVPMRKCVRKHSCMSSPFSIAILNVTCSLRAPILFCGDVPAIKQLKYKQTNCGTTPAVMLRQTTVGCNAGHRMWSWRQTLQNFTQFVCEQKDVNWYLLYRVFRKNVPYFCIIYISS